jgi:hypothetical protein
VNDLHLRLLHPVTWSTAQQSVSPWTWPRQDAVRAACRCDTAGTRIR